MDDRRWFLREKYIMYLPNLMLEEEMKAQVIEAPSLTSATYDKSLFIAGGITNCPNWQHELIDALQNLEITIYNPRREKFPADNPVAAREQIAWEFNKLRKANYVSFWFCQETLCPITLFELGATMERTDNCIIGVHPEYKHRYSVEVQANLKNHTVLYSLSDLAYEITHGMTKEYLF